MHVVLIGLMAAGKTSVGRRLAVRLGWPFVDNDEQVRELAGCSAREILERDGATALHELESDALRAALAGPEPTVVAAAAGVVLDPALRRELREHAVVWLRAEPAVLTARARSGQARPWLDQHVEERLAQMERERAALYREAADLVVEADSRGPLETAEAVAEWLGEAAPAPTPAPAAARPAPRRS